MQIREGRGPELRLPPPAPCTLVPWSHLGQMGHEPGRGPGNMLRTRCCRGAVPSQVNKLHTKHKQSAVCLAPFRGRHVHRNEPSSEKWLYILGVGWGWGWAWGRGGWHLPHASSAPCLIAWPSQVNGWKGNFRSAAERPMENSTVQPADLSLQSWPICWGGGGRQPESLERCRGPDTEECSLAAGVPNGLEASQAELSHREAQVCREQHTGIKRTPSGSRECEGLPFQQGES